MSFEKALQFAELSPAQKRVAIAKDVLKQLELNTFRPTRMEYFYADSKSCKACAVGATFMSLCFLKNLADVPLQIGSLWHDSRHIKTILKEYFPPLQIDMIEHAFENFTCVHSGAIKKAMAWGKAQGDNPAKRLKAIMENIIENNGCFIPF